MAAANNRSDSAGGKAHGENSASFEENFVRLQEVVAKLSDGNLTLEEALGAYEEGMALADRCARMLDEAESRVKQVSERAMRAGVASLDDLRPEMGVEDLREEHRLVAIEIETFDAAPLNRNDVSGKDSSPSPDPLVFGKKSQPAQRPPAKPLTDELDPLFDDDD
jgi:exodeoxyribonuclease VII small subunit